MGEFWRLVGATILGALISFGATFFFERRKEQRAEQAESQRRSKELRQATRLVLEELQANMLLLGWATEGQWWSNPPHDLDQHVWLEYRGTLALVIEEQFIWEEVIASQVQIGDLNRRLGISRMQAVPFVEADFSITNEWVDVINDVLYRVQKGVDALGSMLRP